MDEPVNLRALPRQASARAYACPTALRLTYTKNLLGGRFKKLANSMPVKCSQGHTANN